MNTSEQFARVERLGDVIVSAQFQTDDTVNVFTTCGEHNHRGLIVGSADTAQNLQTVFARHHQVKHQSVKVFANPETIHGAPVFTNEDLETIFAEITTKKVTKAGVIIDHENFWIAFHELYSY